MNGRTGWLAGAATQARVALPLVQMLATALVAAYPYRRAIGGHGETVRWHLGVLALWLACACGAAAWAPQRWRLAHKVPTFRGATPREAIAQWAARHLLRPR